MLEPEAAVVRALQHLAVEHHRSVVVRQRRGRRAQRRSGWNRARTDASRWRGSNVCPDVESLVGHELRIHEGAAGRGERRHRHKLRTRRPEDSRNERPRSVAGRHPVVSDRRLGESRQSQHGQPVSVRDNHTSSRPTCSGIAARAFHWSRRRLSEPAAGITSSRRRDISDHAGTFVFNGSSTRLQNGPVPADTPIQKLGGFPPRDYRTPPERSQLRATRTRSVCRPTPCTRRTPGSAAA